MSQSLFRGSGVALVTPMTPDGIDFPALEQLIEWHIASSTDALILCATTGEGATLTYAERAEIIERSVQQVNGRVPVIVGTGSNNTASAIALSREACAAGADGPVRSTYTVIIRMNFRWSVPALRSRVIKSKSLGPMI